MQRSISEPRDTPFNSFGETLPATGLDRAQEIVSSPTPGELFFETGIVLAVALVVAAIGQFIAAAA